MTVRSYPTNPALSLALDNAAIDTVRRRTQTVVDSGSRVRRHTALRCERCGSRKPLAEIAGAGVTDFICRDCAGEGAL